VLLVVDIKPDVYQAAQAAIATGRYEGFDQFIEIAMRNQLALERSHAGGPSSLRDQHRDFTGENLPPRPAGGNGPTASAEDWRGAVHRVAGGSIAPLAHPLHLDFKSSFLWGQVNRLLPVVAGIRVLANLLQAEHEPAIPLSTWHRVASEVAVQVGAYLARLDDLAGRKRGELWATAFPSDDRSSKRRYMQQFLGNPARSVLGGAEALQFVEIDDSAGDAQVGLTTQGLELAALNNPIFDGPTPEARFSVLEARFYLEHLRQWLPAEYEFNRHIALLVHEGRTREDLDVDLAKLYPAWEAFISTMRAGVMGRLFDLGLLNRVRSGQRVDYSLTDIAYDLRFVDPQT
jgi:hypothetical protein